MLTLLLGQAAAPPARPADPDADFLLQVSNPSFEAGADGWSPVPGEAEGWEVVAAPAPDGARALRITEAIWVCGPWAEVRGILRITGEWRAEGVTTGSRPTQGGDDLFWIDDAEAPTLRGTGTEDWVRQAWGLRPTSTAWSGVIDGKGRHTTMYRWYIPDPVPFQERLRVAIQQEGPANVQGIDDVSATSLWYQSRPLTPVPALPPFAERPPPPGVVRESWSLPGPVRAVSLPGNAARFGPARCQPVSPQVLFNPPEENPVAGVPFQLGAECADTMSAVVLAPGAPVTLPFPGPTDGDTLYLWWATVGPRGAPGVYLGVAGERLELRFGEHFDPFDDPWPVPYGRLWPYGERGVGVQATFVTAVPLPDGQERVTLEAAPGGSATLYAAVLGPAASDLPPKPAGP